MQPPFRGTSHSYNRWTFVQDKHPSENSKRLWIRGCASQQLPNPDVSRKRSDYLERYTSPFAISSNNVLMGRIPPVHDVWMVLPARERLSMAVNVSIVPHVHRSELIEIGGLETYTTRSPFELSSAEAQLPQEFPLRNGSWSEIFLT